MPLDEDACQADTAGLEVDRSEVWSRRVRHCLPRIEHDCRLAESHASSLYPRAGQAGSLEETAEPQWSPFAVYG